MDYTDPSNLRLLGKKAAGLAGDGAPLTDAVISTVSDKKLNGEQIQRVCEAANQAAYQDKWDKGGPIRNVTFDGGPARAERVIEAVQAKPAPKANLADYATAPSKKDGGVGDMLKRVFGKKTTQEKAASADPYALRSTVAHAEREVRSKLSSAQLALLRAADEMTLEVRRAVMNDETMGKIASAWRIVSPNYADTALDIVRPAVSLDLKRGAYDESMAKTASATIPNRDHPAIASFEKFCKEAHALQVYTNAVLALREELEGLRV